MKGLGTSSSIKLTDFIYDTTSVRRRFFLKASEKKEYNNDDMSCYVFEAFLLVAIISISSASGMNVPPVVTATGNYFDVGYIVGSKTKEFILQRFNVSQSTWQFLLSTPEALMLNQSMFDSTVSTFPQVIEELYGITEGCGLSFAQVFFLNTITELEALESELNTSTSGPKFHCTDVFSSGETFSTSVWGHNEDSDAHDCNVTYLVNATIVDDQGDVVERFVAYTYPASVAGRAFGWNHHGLIITTNALGANNNAFDNPASVPRAFHNRAMYGARSVEEAIVFATGIPTMTPFSLNVGTWTPNRPENVSPLRAVAQYHNIETDPSGVFSIKPVFPRPNTTNWAPRSLKSTTYHFYHANNYQVLIANTTEDVCSTARINRLNEFTHPRTADDVRAMLGDTANATWPVWQHGCAAQLYTMCTAVFRFDLGEIHLYSDNPKTSSATLVFPKL